MNYGVKKTILLKITGNAFLAKDKTTPDVKVIHSIAKQILELKDTHRFAIVTGGGNFFRGNQHGVQLKLTPSIAHQVGMLATMLNGLIIKDIFEQNNLASKMLSALPCPEISDAVSQEAIMQSIKNDYCIVFTGGTGNPFFSTDTTAVLRGLQIKANEVWKGTNVQGIYDSNPAINENAKFLDNISYKEAIDKHLGIMDATAFVLADQHKLPIRVFNIFEDNALIKASNNKNFGSLVS